MKKWKRIFGYWTKKEVNHLAQKGIILQTGSGYESFDIEEENELYKELKKSTFFKNVKEFSDRQIGTSFSEKEINDSYYLGIFFKTKGYPQPYMNFGFLDKTYVEYYKSSGIPKIGQPNPFILKGEPKWKKNELIFTLIWVPDALFVKKDFFDKVLNPLGFNSRKVYINQNKTVAKTVVQWIIPSCSSKMELDNSVYDTGNICSESGIKKYSQQILDFLPPFKEEVSQGICLSKEYFGEGMATFHKIIINKKMKAFFIENKILKSKEQLHPVKNKI